MACTISGNGRLQIFVCFCMALGTLDLRVLGRHTHPLASWVFLMAGLAMQYKEYTHWIMLAGHSQV